MVSGVLPRFWSVGSVSEDLGGAVLSHRPGLSEEPTATFVHNVRCTDRAGLDAALARAEQLLGRPCPRVFLDARTPAVVEACLVAQDWTIEPMLQLLLAAGADLPVPRQVRPQVREATEGDWDALAALFRTDHEEEDARAGRPPRAAATTDRVVAARRALPHPVRYFVGTDADEVVGFVAGWPGDGGPGLVEDLFVRPDHRRRGLATTLITTAVAWARTGSDDVVIGADPADTPRHLYVQLGFQPVEMLRSATRPRQQRPA